METIRDVVRAIDTIEVVLNRKMSKARRSPTQIANINKALGITDELRASLGGLMQLEEHEFKGEKQA